MDDISTQPDFKWFGEGFDGFPKQLPDDCVEYTIFVVDAKLQSEAQIRARLATIRTTAEKLVAEQLKDYIWQRDGFTLDLHYERSSKSRPTSSASTPAGGLPFLRGRSNYGDSVADEWVIVYLLGDLSKRFSDAWIRVFDSDGEFLLIEAANTLPKWLNPEIATNRVWLHSGKLFIVPMKSQNSSKKNRDFGANSITIAQALSFISTQPEKLIHSSLIEEEAFYRIRNYPTDIAENMHHAVITIPRKLAYVLHEKPQNISAAIEAFYLRDPISLKPLNGKRSGALRFPPIDLVEVSVKFTKVGYAQLKSQVFATPAAWAEVMSAMNDSPSVSKLQTGMKVTCGFEMLLADPQNQDKRSVREVNLLLDDLEQDEDEVPSDSAISRWPRVEDDEKWLDIDFDAFDRELSGRKARTATSESSGFGDKHAQENLQKIVERFEAFLNDDAAGPEGAEDFDDMDYDDDDETESSNDGEDREVSFDEDEFEKMMQDMMGMPPGELISFNTSAALPKPQSRVEELDSDDDRSADYENEQMQKVIQDMEDELKELGALDLDSAPRDALSLEKEEAAPGLPTASVNASTTQDDDVNVNYTVAKNLLESFKAQAGTAGPAGTMMSMMGVHLPRDEKDIGKDG